MELTRRSFLAGLTAAPFISLSVPEVAATAEPARCAWLVLHGVRVAHIPRLSYSVSREAVCLSSTGWHQVKYPKSAIAGTVQLEEWNPTAYQLALARGRRKGLKVPGLPILPEFDLEIVHPDLPNTWVRGCRTVWETFNTQTGESEESGYLGLDFIAKSLERPAA
jgi:hypothetical protein